MRLESFNPFDVCFNLLKLRYKDYDESITNKHFLNRGDKVNVFINMESVLKYISMIPDLEKKLLLERNYKIILLSNFLNLAAHYKRFFVNNGLDTRIYLYSTDLDSTEFKQNKYNEDFRCYYLTKFNNNPKFVYLTENLKGEIFKNLKTYCDFIPRVYFLSSKNVDGSLIPYTVAMDDTSRKNFIVGSDLMESQYSLIPNFVNHLIKKAPGELVVLSSVQDYICSFVKKKPDEIKDMIDCYNNYSMYCSLLALGGDRNRSNDGLNGYGPVNFYNALKQGVAKNEIQFTTNNPELIGTVFHDSEMKEDFVNEYYCTSILDMYKEMTQIEKDSILNQRADRYDLNSLQSLNNTMFRDYPLILEALLG